MGDDEIGRRALGADSRPQNGYLSESPSLAWTRTAYAWPSSTLSRSFCKC